MLRRINRKKTTDIVWIRKNNERIQMVPKNIGLDIARREKKKNFLDQGT